MSNNFTDYYAGPERRMAAKPRRSDATRRHRLRTESLISDCRTFSCRRNEDDEGFIEISNLSDENTETKIISPKT